jgi:hypothetical protein
MARITRYVTHEWKWGRDFYTLFESDMTIEEIKFAYQSALTLIHGIESGSEIASSFNFAIKLLVPKGIGGVKIQPILSLFRSIAAIAGKSAEFEAAFNQIQDGLKNPGEGTDTIEIEEIKEDRFSFYGSLFG